MLSDTKKVVKDVRENVFKFCSPAKAYFILSVISFIIIAAQNISTKDKFCLGSFECVASTSTVLTVMAFQLLYIFLWTWVLNLVCSSGKPMISWLLLLFPYVLMFVLLGLFMLLSGVKGLKKMMK